MAMDLTQLQQLMQQAAQAQGSQGGFEGQLERANALRDTPELKPAGDTGYINPLRQWQRLRSMGRGEEQAATAQAGLAKTRQQIAQAQSGRDIYGLQTTAEHRKEDVDWRQQQAAAQVEAERVKAQAQSTRYGQEDALTREMEDNKATLAKAKDIRLAARQLASDGRADAAALLLADALVLETSVGVTTGRSTAEDLAEAQKALAKLKAELDLTAQKQSQVHDVDTASTLADTNIATASTATGVAEDVATTDYDRKVYDARTATGVAEDVATTDYDRKVYDTRTATGVAEDVADKLAGTDVKSALAKTVAAKDAATAKSDRDVTAAEVEQGYAQDNINLQGDIGISAAEIKARAALSEFKKQEARLANTAAVKAGERSLADYTNGEVVKSLTYDNQGIKYLDGIRLEKQSDWTKAAVLSDVSTRAMLPAASVQKGLESLEKKSKPLRAMYDAIDRLQEGLAPYAKGGAKASKGNIPGLGFLEGMQGGTGDVIRYVSDTFGGGGKAEAGNIAAAIRGFVGPIIKNEAGLAQTLSETASVISRFGLTPASDEKVFLRAYPSIIKAINNDIRAFKGTRMPQVLSMFQKSMGGKSLFDRPELEALDWSNRITPDQSSMPQKSALPKTTGEDKKWSVELVEE